MVREGKLNLYALSGMLEPSAQPLSEGVCAIAVPTCASRATL